MISQQIAHQIGVHGKGNVVEKLYVLNKNYLYRMLSISTKNGLFRYSNTSTQIRIETKVDDNIESLYVVSSTEVPARMPADSCARIHLVEFLENKAFFNSTEEQASARKTYNELVEKENELRCKLKDQFHIQQCPKDFDFKSFSSKVGNNVLAKALLDNFNKGIGPKAAWDYLTLKHSATELLGKGKSSGDKAAEKPRGQGDGQPQPSTSGGNPQQEISQDVDMEMDEREYEKQVEEDRKSVIVSLLMVNHDYFDQILLNKAYSEFRYFKNLEKEWKAKGNKGEIKADPKDKLDLLPKSRAIYAVIATILTNANEVTHAQAAEKEYMKYINLEKTMKKEIPKEILISSGDPSWEQITSKYRTPKMTFRQAAEFKMAPMEEYRRLKQTIEHQRNQISELSTRLSGIANQQVADGEIFTDIGNNNTPRRLGQRFADVYEEQWTNAYEFLKPKKPEGQEDEKDEMDEKTMDILQKIVRIIYEFCHGIADQQVTFLISGMTPPIVAPTSSDPVRQSEQDEKEMQMKTEKMAKDYRKTVAPATIETLKMTAIKEVEASKLIKGSIGKEVKEYIECCVHLIWYMCIQQPPMVMVWGKPGEKFNKELFRLCGKKGLKYRLTVWPVVLYHEKGNLACAGYAIPQ